MPEQMTTTATTTTTTTTTTTSAHQAQPLSFGDVLEELEIRFLANLPDEDLASAERLYQHIEQAHWFYEDFYADNHEHLPHLGLGAFISCSFALLLASLVRRLLGKAKREGDAPLKAQRRCSWGLLMGGRCAICPLPASLLRGSG